MALKYHCAVCEETEDTLQADGWFAIFRAVPTPPFGQITMRESHVCSANCLKTHGALVAEQEAKNAQKAMALAATGDEPEGVH